MTWLADLKSMKVLKDLKNMICLELLKRPSAGEDKIDINACTDEFILFSIRSLVDFERL